MLSQTEARALEMITDAAARGRVAPSNPEIAQRCGLASIGAASAVVQRLEKLGIISVERYPTARRIMITATGEQTYCTNKGEYRRQIIHTVRHGSRDYERPQRLIAVNRDPCPKCGVRGDIGCRHQSPEPPVVVL